MRTCTAQPREVPQMLCGRVVAINLRVNAALIPAYSPLYFVCRHVELRDGTSRPADEAASRGPLARQIHCGWAKGMQWRVRC